VSELRTIKLVVGGMTLLLVGMLGLLLWGLSRPPAPPAFPPPPSAPAWTMAVPEGKIVSVTGSGPFLAVLTESEAGRKIFLFDPHGPRLVGTLADAPSPSPALTTP